MGIAMIGAMDRPVLHGVGQLSVRPPKRLLDAAA